VVLQVALEDGELAIELRRVGVEGVLVHDARAQAGVELEGLAQGVGRVVVVPGGEERVGEDQVEDPLLRRELHRLGVEVHRVAEAPLPERAIAQGQVVVGGSVELTALRCGHGNGCLDHRLTDGDRLGLHLPLDHDDVGLVVVDVDHVVVVGAGLVDDRDAIGIEGTVPVPARAAAVVPVATPVPVAVPPVAEAPGGTAPIPAPTPAPVGAPVVPVEVPVVVAVVVPAVVVAIVIAVVVPVVVVVIVVVVTVVTTAALAVVERLQVVVARLLGALLVVGQLRGSRVLGALGVARRLGGARVGGTLGVALGLGGAGVGDALGVALGHGGAGVGGALGVAAGPGGARVVGALGIPPDPGGPTGLATRPALPGDLGAARVRKARRLGHGPARDARVLGAAAGTRVAGEDVVARHRPVSDEAPRRVSGGAQTGEVLDSSAAAQLVGQARARSRRARARSRAAGLPAAEGGVRRPGEAHPLRRPRRGEVDHPSIVHRPREVAARLGGVARAPALPRGDPAGTRGAAA